MSKGRDSPGYLQLDRRKKAALERAALNPSAQLVLCMAVYKRRNYLFAGSDAGGDTAACLYSLIGTCRLNSIDPHLYLRHVLECIATHPINRIDELLPWRVGPLLPLALSRAA
jgi:transposase